MIETREEDVDGLRNRALWLLAFGILSSGMLGCEGDGTAAFQGGSPGGETSNPQVLLLSPNGGETLIDSTVVAWSAEDPDPGETPILSIDLEYTSDGGEAWLALGSDLANSGFHEWDVSALPGGDSYLVRVTAADSTLAPIPATVTTFAEWKETHPRTRFMDE
jgi:hypothetical protein